MISVEYYNYYAGGLSLWLECSNFTMELDTLTFSYNRGHVGGNLDIVIKSMSKSDPITTQNCVLEEGIAFTEGALHMSVVQFTEPHLSIWDCSHAHLLQILNTQNISKNYGLKDGNGLFLYTIPTKIDTSLCS